MMILPVRVIVPPAAIVVPSDIPGDHAGNDPRVAAVIAGVQGTIDGPSGWLGRALGVQELEIARACFPGHAFRLPYPPIAEIVSVTWLDDAGVAHVLDETDYRLIGGDRIQFMAVLPSIGHQPDAVRIRYRAGYDGVAVADGGTGAVPANAKLAVQLSVQHLLSVGARDLYLRSEEVPGVSTLTYTVSEAASALIKRTAEELLGPLRVMSL